MVETEIDESIHVNVSIHTFDNVDNDDEVVEPGKVDEIQYLTGERRSANSFSRNPTKEDHLTVNAFT